MSDNTEDTQLWWEKRIAKEAAEKDAVAGRYDPPPTDHARVIYDEIYYKLSKVSTTENHIMSHIEPKEFQKLRSDFMMLGWHEKGNPNQLGYILELDFPADEALEPIVFITKSASLGQNCISDVFLNGNKISGHPTTIIASGSRMIFANYYDGIVIDVPFSDIEAVDTRINDEIYVIENIIQTKDKQVVISSQFTLRTINKAGIILDSFFNHIVNKPSRYPVADFGISKTIPDKQTILTKKQMQINHQQERSGNEFSLSGCISSFIITLLIAISLGLAVPFIIFLLTGSLPLAIILYIALFGIVWWATYNILSHNRQK